MTLVLVGLVLVAGYFLLGDADPLSGEPAANPKVVTSVQGGIQVLSPDYKTELFKLFATLGLAPVELDVPGVPADQRAVYRLERMEANGLPAASAISQALSSGKIAAVSLPIVGKEMYVVIASSSFESALGNPGGPFAILKGGAL